MLESGGCCTVFILGYMYVYVPPKYYFGAFSGYLFFFLAGEDEERGVCAGKSARWFFDCLLLFWHIYSLEGKQIIRFI